MYSETNDAGMSSPQPSQVETTLQRQSDFISFLNRILVELLYNDTDRIDQSINELLDYSCSIHGCERALVYLLNTEGLQLQVAYKWNSVDTSPIAAMEQILVSDLPGISNRISNGEVILREVPGIANGSDDVLLAEILDLSHFRSFVVVPLKSSNKNIGLLFYFSKRSASEWNPLVVNSLKLIGQIVTVTIDRQHIALELNNAKEKAAESDKLKTAFLASMSHEIRTPMNHILGFIELLKDSGLSEAEKNEFMDIVKSSGNLLLRLIDDIIDIAKLESGQMVINPIDFQLNRFVTDIQQTFGEQLKLVGKGKIEFVVEKPENGLIDSIRIDSLRLHQIVSNLLSNALKFTQEGKITFGYSLEEDNKLHFYIEDTGIGIPVEKQNEVFERFRQLESSYAREYSGTGLGLAISKGLVELMNGEIGLVSKQGNGSRFFFTIPYIPIQKEPKQLITRTLGAKNYNFAGKTILVVEDDEINFRFLEIVIHQNRARVIRALTGREAIDISLNQEIHLVLMDIQIPIIDGYTATREIKKVKPYLPIIAQTAHALAEEKTLCLESGADDYLSKPINRRELLAKMALYIES